MMQMKRFTRWQWSVIVLLAAAIGVMLFAVVARDSGDSSAGREPSVALEESSPIAPAAVDQLPSIERAPRLEPLPLATAPLANTFDEMANRAQKGDQLASCKLAARLLRCREWLVVRRHELNYQTRVTDKPSDMAEPMVVEGQSEPPPPFDNYDRTLHADLAQMCDGVTRDKLDRAYQFQVIAAEAGSIQYKLDYVRNPALPFENFVNEIDLWKDFRVRAPRYLWQAIRAGNPDAVVLLARLHSPDRNLGQRGAGTAGLSIPDAERAALFYLLYAEYLGYTLDPGERASFEFAKNAVGPSKLNNLRSTAFEMGREHFQAKPGRQLHDAVAPEEASHEPWDDRDSCDIVAS